MVFAKQSEQQVLRLDEGTSVLAGFVAGKENDAAGFLCVALKHWFFSNLRRAAGAAQFLAIMAGGSCRKEDTTGKTAGICPRKGFRMNAEKFHQKMHWGLMKSCTVL